MNPIIPAAANLQEFFQKRKWRFCIIGGVAVLRWGEVRATKDVDVTHHNQPFTLIKPSKPRKKRR